MSGNFKDMLRKAYSVVSNRIFLMFLVFVLGFYWVCAGLFNLQIVNGYYYLQTPEKETYSKTIPIAAPRGEIYDRYGRPLAVNLTDYSIKIDPSVAVSSPNEVYLNFIDLMDRNGEKIADDFPISSGSPKEFLFNGSKTREERWKKDLDIDLSFDAEQSYDYVKNTLFKIPDGLDADVERKLLSLRNNVFLERYRLTPITVAMGVKDITVAALEEGNQDYPGFYTDVDYLRNYPQGEYMAHILGYIRGIASDEYEFYKSLGYTSTDLIGKDGIEKAFEFQLKGENGERIIYTDEAGRRIGAGEETSPVQGDKVFLTIDLDLQIKTTDILEKMLADILISRLKAGTEKDKMITAKSLMVSMATADNLSLDKILAAADGSDSAAIKNYLVEKSGLDSQNKNYKKDMRAFLAQSLEEGKITVNSALLALWEQGVITMTPEEADKARHGVLSSQSFVIAKAVAGEITPQLAHIEPCTGSVVILDVNTGGVLASANYPNYDNNRLVNNFDNDYWRKLNADPTIPLVNRAFALTRAPGSTFKMITAIAGLETGTIDLNTQIYDKGVFTDAGVPYARCWIASRGGSHGIVDVKKALEVSCNYFFYETAYRMGNSKDENKLQGIETLNQYMVQFGLNSPTGVEIYELNKDSTNIRISSPEFKVSQLTAQAKAQGTPLSQSQLAWKDGDTIRTAIGQSLNNYTTASMAKYVATLANGGTRYQTHFLNKLENSTGETLKVFEPVVEEVIDIKPENLAAVYQGMVNVTQGTNGTAKTAFAGFPMTIPGKTGTAQQDAEGNDHASFTCFAPLDNPQIAIYVMMPYGNVPTLTYPAVKVTRQILEYYFGVSEAPSAAAAPEPAEAISSRLSR